MKLFFFALSLIGMFIFFRRQTPREVSFAPHANDNSLPGGSALAAPHRERELIKKPLDPIDEASFESFPASDPPAW